jgi:Tfp pilus assembly protein PilP
MRCALPIVLALMLVAPLRAQTPAAAAPAPAQPPKAAPPHETQEKESFMYAPDGRRDPFVSLVGTGATSDTRATGRRGEGVAGLGANEISVRGILQSRGAYVAMIQGPDNKTYVVRPGDRLADGTIKTVTPQGLVVVQEVTDPLSLVKQREVTKLLRSLEGVK